MRGTIALDVDGTITLDHHQVPIRVAAFLSDLIAEGWVVVFITGRTFLRTAPILAGIEGKFYLAVQNGAQVFEMPSRNAIASDLIGLDQAVILSERAEGEPTDVVVYSPSLKRDLLYWRPHAFSPELRDYVERRAKAFKEELVSVQEFSEIEEAGAASLKLYGTQQSLQKIAPAGLEFPIILDPFSWEMFLGQATPKGVNKGSVFRYFPAKPLIVCGDDWNDLPMLEKGDVKVVMETAPEQLKQMADILAPPAGKEGIIEGLQKALLWVGH